MPLAFPIRPRAVCAVRLGAIATDGTAWPELVGILLLLGPRPRTFTRGTAAEHRHLVLNIQGWIAAVHKNRTRWTFLYL